jgi:hypothetical protein
LGFSLLVRPVPGVAFVLVGLASAWFAVAKASIASRLHRLIPIAVPVSVAVLAIAATHLAQSGSPLISGYHQVHGELGLLSGGGGAIGLSVFAAAVRENFWLFGWPLSLLPVLFARPRRGRWLLWGPLVAQLIYRIAVPKTVVSTTGPVYLLETVPLTALLAADGLARLELLLGRWWGRPKAQERITSWVVASVLSGLVLFLPVVAGSVSAGAAERLIVMDRLAEAGSSRALVFCDGLVAPRQGKTWALYAPNPSPSMDDAVLFVRWPEQGGPPRALEFWRKHFPDRPAFRFLPGPAPQLVPLEAAGP